MPSSLCKTAASPLGALENVGHFQPQSHFREVNIKNKKGEMPSQNHKVHCQEAGQSFGVLTGCLTVVFLRPGRGQAHKKKNLLKE